MIVSNKNRVTALKTENANLREHKSQSAVSELKVMVSVRKLNFYYGQYQALFDNNIDIFERQVTAIIGPSGCGKSTHIRTYNRIYELYRDQRVEGQIMLDGQNILEDKVDLIQLRHKVGMIFQKPSPFPMSIFENVAYGLRLHNKMLSGGQQQRLCIARAITVEPVVLLMDEPCSAIDPIATSKIEDLIETLKKKYTIVLVTHNMQQAARVSDYTAFFYQGRIIEFGRTTQIFENPSKKQTEDYITGRFG
jgi:phosphate transport system ATP-binding protein